MKHYALIAALFIALAGCSDDSDSNNANNGNNTNNSNNSNNANNQNNREPLEGCAGVLSNSTELARPIYDRVNACFSATGVECAANDSDLATAQTALADALLEGCSDEDYATLQSGEITREAWAARVAHFHQLAAKAFSRRFYGGPKGVYLAEQSECAQAAYEGAVTGHLEGLDLAFYCDNADCAEPDLKAAWADVADGIATACGEEAFGLLASSTAGVARTGMDQTACVAAAMTEEALGLPCGPSEQGATEFTQVRLSQETYDVKCGDGSDYYFHYKLGDPTKVVAVMQGGGVCLQGGDCVGRPDRLFKADDDMPVDEMFADSEDNPFRGWTMIYMPYCTQDVHSGNGTTESFVTNGEEFVIERYGALNVRNTLKYVRDIIWHEMDYSGGEYRPEAVTAVFAGISAGGLGVYTNHAWVLDELGWINTIAMPRVWLSISAPPPFSLASLLGIKRDAWAIADSLPAYCNGGSCVAGTTFIPIHADRLGETPLQRWMSFSSQADTTQSGTTYHGSVFRWTNLAREYYCTLKDTPNVNFFLYANPEVFQSLIDGAGTESGHSPNWEYEIDGATAMDWIWTGYNDPENVRDYVDEGTLVQLSQDAALTGLEAYEATEPFDCTVTP